MGSKSNTQKALVQWPKEITKIMLSQAGKIKMKHKLSGDEILWSKLEKRSYELSEGFRRIKNWL